MSNQIIYSVNRASEAIILLHLQACDSAFIPPLGARVELHAYARKIAIRAVRFEAWAEDLLIGLVATYCRDNQDDHVAFITSVSMLDAWKGIGIARELLCQCALYAEAQGFQELRLEVGSNNFAAIQLYLKSGYVVDATIGEFIWMSLKL